MLEVQKFSYHSHTNFSDGHESALAMVRRAKEIGFCELGISDHLIVHKNMRSSPSCKVNDYMRLQPHIYNTDFKNILPSFQRHCEELRQVAKEENFKLYIGFEVDFFTYDGWLEELQEFLKQLDYDYVISGKHFLFDEECEQVVNLTDLAKLYDDSAIYTDYLQRHFKTMAMAVKTKMFKFLAHIDYARRLGDNICGPNNFVVEKLEVLDALAENNIGVEISTKGLRKVNDFYPDGNILQAAAERNIAFVISDDAHEANELGNWFVDAEERLRQFNIKNRLQF